MKKNLYLDPSTTDLVIGTNYNLRFTSSLSEYIAQKLKNVLRTFSGEWFLDYTLGIPFFDRILIKNADLNDINSIFLAAISSISEIQKVISFTTSMDNMTRNYTIDFSVQLIDETVVSNSGVII